MVFNFYYNTLSEKDELQKIIKEEATKHFGTEFSPTSEGTWHSVSENNYIKFVVKNIDYANDIEVAKQEFYNDKKTVDVSELYLKDFLSEVFENLSFAPMVNIKE